MTKKKKEKKIIWEEKETSAGRQWFLGTPNRWGLLMHLILLSASVSVVGVQRAPVDTVDCFPDIQTHMHGMHLNSSPAGTAEHSYTLLIWVMDSWKQKHKHSSTYINRIMSRKKDDISLLMSHENFISNVFLITTIQLWLPIGEVKWRGMRCKDWQSIKGRYAGGDEGKESWRGWSSYRRRLMRGC